MYEDIKTNSEKFSYIRGLAIGAALDLAFHIAKSVDYADRKPLYMKDDYERFIWCKDELLKINKYSTHYGLLEAIDNILVYWDEEGECWDMAHSTDGNSILRRALDLARGFVDIPGYVRK